ncbi:MAG: transposase [Candidatus Competibacteraceae bacterium]|nr:transposase [Candidatus Competibacteraceae bacterium]
MHRRAIQPLHLGVSTGSLIEPQRIEIPIENPNDRQTYYGALNLYNKDFVLTPYDRGNGENTVLFIQHLQALNKDKKLIIIWDGASYHCCKEVQDYLNKINGEVEEKIGK